MISIQEYIGKLAEIYADKTVLENNQSLAFQHIETLDNTCYAKYEVHAAVQKKTKEFDYSKYAIALNICDKHITHIALAAYSAKYFCPGIKIFGLVVSNISTSTIEMCRQFSIQLIDCKTMFNAIFPWFKRHNIETCIHPGNNRTYSKYVFGRFVIPLCDEFKQFDKVLYIDNDCIVVAPLNTIFIADTKKACASVIYDSQDIRKKKKKRAYDILKQFDKRKMLKDYWCSGIIMFNMDNYDENSYRQFLQYADELEEDIFKARQRFFADQDILNLCLDFNVLKTWDGHSLAASSFCGLDVQHSLWHYYSIARNSNFIKDIAIKLDSKKICTEWIAECLSMLNYKPVWYFSAEGSNFGDKCSSNVISALADVFPLYTSKNTVNRLVFTGSILNELKQFGWKLYDSDVVYGSGCMQKDGPLPKNCKANIQLVRGPLTRNELIKAGIQCPEKYGDPGIFIPFACKIKSESKKYAHGLILHFRDKAANSNNIIQIAKQNNIQVIDVFDDPINICKKIQSCSHIYSSSLHGIIVAEAMGISATWVELSNLLEGNGFKFYDYYLGSGRSEDDVVRLDWKDQSAIQFDSYKSTRPPTYYVSQMLDAFPLKLKLVLKNNYLIGFSHLMCILYN